MNREDTLDKAADAVIKSQLEDGYLIEMFLSTDGKHTVHTKAWTKEGKESAYKAGIALYDRILERYGTKQAQAVKEYAKDKGGMCPIHKKPWREGKFGKFCSTKMDDGTWCKQKPKE